MQEKEIRASDTGCPSCGAVMVYSPERQKLYCKSCQTCKDIAKEAISDKRAWNEKNKGVASTKTWANKAKKLKCPNCGASIELKKLEYSKSCPYCTSNLVGILQGEEILDEPDGIIPFTFSFEDASNKYMAGIKKKFFAPRKFKKAPPVENIKGIYMPSFSFDANTVSTYKGVLAEDDSYTDSSGRRRTKTSYKHISGTHTAKNIDVVVESSSAINQAQLNEILPFNMSRIVKFQQGFIMGYTVEQYESTVDQCKGVAKRIMEENIKSAILSKYHYDRVSSFDMTTKYSEEKYLYYLLPIYKCDYLYKDKTYTTFMNGQTGKVGGGYPISKLKVTMVVLSILAVIGGFIALITSLG